MRFIRRAYALSRPVARAIANPYCALGLAAVSIVWALFDLMAHLLHAG
jgi:hypothetical protein